jgi:predicted dehydrogenase
MAERYRIGIAGLDHWYVGLAAAESAVRNPKLELVAIAHRDPERLAETVKRFGAKHAASNYREVVERDDVDVVVTSCYTSENADIVVAAANAKKHIVSVKPIAMNVADADRIVKAVKDNGVKFISNESPYRTYPAIARIKSWFDSGKLGKPISAYTALRAPIPRQWWPGRFGDTWWLDPTKSPGGGWIDHAIYHIDALRWIFGSEVAQISGVVDNLLDKTLKPGMEDFGVANVVFEAGQIAIVEVTWTGKVGGSYNAFQVVGTEGQAVYDTTTTGKISVIGNFEESGWFQVDSGPQNYSVLDHLIDCLENDKPTIADAKDARENLAACLAFYEAAKAGRAVKLR